jgi:hypothetical protein
VDPGEGRGSKKEVGRTTNEGDDMTKQQRLRMTGHLENFASLQFALLMLRLGVRMRA